MSCDVSGDEGFDLGFDFDFDFGLDFDVGICGTARGRWLLALNALFAGRAATMERLVPSPSAFWEYSVVRNV